MRVLNIETQEKGAGAPAHHEEIRASVEFRLGNIVSLNATARTTPAGLVTAGVMVGLHCPVAHRLGASRSATRLIVRTAAYPTVAKSVLPLSRPKQGPTDLLLVPPKNGARLSLAKREVLPAATNRARGTPRNDSTNLVDCYFKPERRRSTASGICRLPRNLRGRARGRMQGGRAAARPARRRPAPASRVRR